MATDITYSSWLSADVGPVGTFIFNAGASLLTSGGTTDLWASSTVKARLVDSSIVPDVDDADMTTFTGIGTDPTLSSKTKTKNTTLDRIIFGAANAIIVGPAAAQEYGCVVVYKFVTDDTGSTPLFCLGLTPATTDGSDLTILWSATGIGFTQQ